MCPLRLLFTEIYWVFIVRTVRYKTNSLIAYKKKVFFLSIKYNYFQQQKMQKYLKEKQWDLRFLDNMLLFICIDYSYGFLFAF